MIKSDISTHLNVSELQSDQCVSACGPSSRQEMKCCCKVERRRSRTYFWRYHYTDSCCEWASICPMKPCSWFWISADDGAVGGSVRLIPPKNLLNRSRWDLSPRADWFDFCSDLFLGCCCGGKDGFGFNQYSRVSPGVWIQSNHSSCVAMCNSFHEKPVKQLLKISSFPS